MLDIDIVVNENEVIVRPVGQIDTLTSKQFQDECMKVIDNKDVMILDFEKVEYLTSAGLRIIMVLQQIQDENNRLLKLCNVNELIMEILDTVGFLDFLAID